MLARFPRFAVDVLICSVAVAAAGIAIASGDQGWPPWLAEYAAAAFFVIAMPWVVAGLQDGLSRPLLRRLRHRRWWLDVWLVACPAVFADRLGWPPTVAFASGGLALVCVGWVL